MQRFISKKNAFWDYIFIIVGTGLLAASIQCLFDPVSLVTGGFTGLAIVIKEMTTGIVPGGLPLWLTNIMLNIPVFLIAYKVKGRSFIFRTVVGTGLLSAWLYVIPIVDLSQGDHFLASVVGGAVAGPEYSQESVNVYFLLLITVLIHIPASLQDIKCPVESAYRIRL